MTEPNPAMIDAGHAASLRLKNYRQMMREGMHKSTVHSSLPEPWDYAYEWNGPFGTRKLSVAPHNGRGPDRSVPIYTADQMRQAQADAARAALEQLEKIIDNDAHAMRFQTLGQYRTSLLAAIRALAREVQR